MQIDGCSYAIRAGQQAFCSAIIERYRRREASIEEHSRDQHGVVFVESKVDLQTGLSRRWTCDRWGKSPPERSAFFWVFRALT
jgi:hypothetical protein